jgi:Domain of unknown function (DUF929)
MAAPSEPFVAGPQSTPTSSRPVPVGLMTIGVVLVVLVIVIVLVVLKFTDNSPSAHTPTSVQQAPAALVHQIANIPSSVFDSIGDPQSPVLEAPKAIRGGSVPTVGGRPAVVWVGALFCPYCAADRWALVVALGRFGTFGKLYTTASSGSDAFPDTVTFSLEGAVYSSSRVALSAVEEYGNQPSRYAPAGFARLGYPDALQSAAMRSYDRAPWAEPDELPFMDVAGKLVVSGQMFSPAVLGGYTMQQVANDLSDPTTAVAQSVLGAANQITAAICAATSEKPATVCSTSAVRTTAARLGLRG